MTDYEEKRNFVRMNIETPVSYWIKGKTQTVYQGKSGNLSATGLNMVSTHQPSVGDLIELEMRTSHDRFDPFIAEGEVIRVEPDPNDSALFHVSVELSKTS